MAAATPGALRAQNKSDVIVIGAGLSGLASALMLQDAGVNVVQVIEGRNRIGGRVESFRNIPGNPGGWRYRLRTGLCTPGRRGPNKYGVELIDITPIVPFFMQRQLILGDEADQQGSLAERIRRTRFPTRPGEEIMPWAYVPMNGRARSIH